MFYLLIYNLIYVSFYSLHCNIFTNNSTIIQMHPNEYLILLLQKTNSINFSTHLKKTITTQIFTHFHSILSNLHQKSLSNPQQFSKHFPKTLHICQKPKHKYKFLLATNQTNYFSSQFNITLTVNENNTSLSNSTNKAKKN